MNRINISLDSLDRGRFERITRTKTFDDVIAGIDAAQASPLRPVKVNAVLVRGINDDEVEAFAEFARDRDLIMRFIEYMPLDADRSWTRDSVVTGAEVLSRISARWPLVPVAHERSETARKYRFADGRGEIGLISPVSQPFCGHCSRIRLTADGKLRTCLFSKEDHDLKFLLRGGATDREIAGGIISIVAEKEKGHRINEPGFVPPSRTMVSIGGRRRILEQATVGDEESKLFSLSEAERLRVQLEPVLIEAIEARRKFGEFDDQLSALAERIQRSGGMLVEFNKTATLRLERNRLEQTIRDALDKIHATGCIVKDLEVGLLDFPSRIDGEEVYLCWRLGEDRIRFYHRQDEGFAGRKPIDPRDADYRNPIQ